MIFLYASTATLIITTTLQTMMDFLAEYGMFLAKALTVFAVFMLFVGGIGAMRQQRRRAEDGDLEIKDINQEYRQMEAALDTVLDRKQRKRKHKMRKKEAKARKKHDAVMEKSDEQPSRDNAKSAGDAVSDKRSEGDTDSVTDSGGQGDNSGADDADSHHKDEGDSGEHDRGDNQGDGRDGRQGGPNADGDAKEDGNAPSRRKRIYVLTFRGDLQASAVASLRQEVSALLTVVGRGDEVVVRLESAGGVVHGYGLGASQLARLRDGGVSLTVTVDKVAASGGYLMACVAERIIAAPFAIIGSIGVLAQIPNMHRLLKKHDIDFEQFTAGEFKRTVTMFGDTTQKMRDKMQQDIDDIHNLFKDFVTRQRPQLDINLVATGEHWPALKALELGLVDEVCTSDDYLMSRRNNADIYAVRWVQRQTLGQKLRLPLAKLFGRGVLTELATAEEDHVATRYLMR